MKYLSRVMTLYQFFIFQLYLNNQRNLVELLLTVVRPFRLNCWSGGKCQTYQTFGISILYGLRLLFGIRV